MMMMIVRLKMSNRALKNLAELIFIFAVWILLKVTRSNSKSLSLCPFMESING